MRNEEPSDITSIDLAGSLDCALIYYPIGPSTLRSLEYLAHTPIGPDHPAILLTTKGPALLWPEKESRGRQYEEIEHRDLSSILCRLALIAEPSLASLTDSWIQSVGPNTTRLPACAITIGIIYDAEVVHLVAHIPYTAHGRKRQYLSLLFDTIPFPSVCVGNTRDFVRERYRVALALLSLQQHAFRLVALTELSYKFCAPFESEPTQQAVMRSRLEELGWRLVSPTPSSDGSEHTLAESTECVNITH